MLSGFLRGAIMLALIAVLGVGHSSVARADASSYADITVDRSTPEQNLRTFISAVDRSILRLKAREWAREFRNAWLYPPITTEQAAEIALLKRYVLDSMDLSGIPDWRRESAGIEAALMLREVLAAENVTSKTTFRQLRDGLWVIPGTYVQAGAIGSGMRAGDVVFTADTVANIASFYQTVADSRGDGFNAYRYFTETPGGLTPPRWAGLAHKMPDVLRWSFGSNTIFQWLITVVILVGLGAIPVLAGRLIGMRSLRWFVQAVLLGVLANSASGVVIDQAGLSGPAATVVTLLLLALHYGALVATVLIIGEWVGSWLSAIQKAKDKSFDTSIIRLATRVVSVVTAIAITIYGISTAGVPVLGIIAGFGVGGLAVALAAKPTLENLLAGVILFLDGSIKVGDTIDSGPLSGTIEDIGMRSTRIRSADGGLVSVTNSELADKVIKNTSRRVQTAQAE